MTACSWTCFATSWPTTVKLRPGRIRAPLRSLNRSSLSGPAGSPAFHVRLRRTAAVRLPSAIHSLWVTVGPRA
jgi:hypothetical protein